MLPRARYEALIDEALGDPEAEATLYRELAQPAAVLIAGFLGSRHRAHADGPIYAAALARAAADALTGALAEPPLMARPLRDGLLLAFSSPTQALFAAMDGLVALAALNAERTGRIGDGSRRDPALVGIGLGFGEVILTPEPDVLGAEADAAFHLAGAAEPGEILASDGFVAALGPPPSGVGAHRGRADRAHRVGMNFAVLRDYRA